MNEHKLLLHLLILLACALPAALVLRRLGQSTVLGYLLTGLVIGPGGLGLLPQESIGPLAEIGVGLLLFTIGIELPLARLRKSRYIVGAGVLQVGLTAAVGTAVLWALTGRFHEALYLGCAAALSSSAIVLKTLADRGDLDAPYTPPATGISIVQDLATVPMMVVLAALGSGGSLAEVARPAALAVAKAAGLMLVLWLGSRYAVDRFLFAVARARSPEIFILAVMTLLLSAAVGAGAAGLSLALGAFLAGMLLADSDYAAQILAEVTPFKGVFQAIFFVSIGMLLDPRAVIAHPAAVLGAAAAIVLGKAILAAAALRIAGTPPQVAVATGIVLAQVGEFSFVLIALGRASGAVPEDVYQLALGASFLSMAVAPPLISSVRRIVGLLARAPGGRPLAGEAEAALAETAKPLTDHVVICGFGPVGRDVAMFLLDHGIAFVAIELNPRTVKEFGGKGLPIFFGDFSNPRVLEDAGIERARALVVAAPDVAAALRAVTIAREMGGQRLLIVARTKYRANVEGILRAGANEAIEEEFETALEMVARLGEALDLDRKAVADRMASLRLERYGRR